MRAREVQTIVVAFVLATIVTLAVGAACDYPKIPPGVDASALSAEPDAPLDARPIDAP